MSGRIPIGWPRLQVSLQTFDGGTGLVVALSPLLLAYPTVLLVNACALIYGSPKTAGNFTDGEEFKSATVRLPPPNRQ